MATNVKEAEKRAVTPMGKADSEPSKYFLVGNENNQSLRIYLRYNLMTGLRDVAIKDTSKARRLLLLGRKHPNSNIIDIAVAYKIRCQDDNDENAWKTARLLAAEKYPEFDIVGWFSSHPNGIDITEEERKIHARYFPEPWQVFYVTDPVNNDRRFYINKAGTLVTASGFRVYGREEKSKVEAKMERETVNTHDERMNARYLEKSIDKLSRRLDTHTIRNIDYVIIALVALTLGIVLLRPNPKADVDPNLIKKVDTLSESISVLDKRVARIDNQLIDIGAIDSQLGLSKKTGTETSDSIATSTITAGTVDTRISSSTSSDTTATVGGIKVGDKAIRHKVAEGDTLYSICEKYYGSSASTSMAEALGKYNKLTPPNYDIFPSDVLIVPAESALKK